MLVRNIRNRKQRSLRLLPIIVLPSLYCAGNNMIKKHIYYIIPTRSNTACKPWVQYATDIKNLLFLARLEFLRKTGRVPHYFQYEEGTFLFFPQNLSLKLLTISFLISVAYCTATCTICTPHHIYVHPLVLQLRYCHAAVRFRFCCTQYWTYILDDVTSDPCSNSRRGGTIIFIVSPKQNTYGLGCGLANN